VGRTWQSKRISRSKRNEPTEALDVTELLGLLIDTAGSPGGDEVREIVALAELLKPI
jgi:hypothetical protein